MFSRDIEHDVNSTASIAAAVILGTIGVLSFIVQPGLGYGFTVAFGVTEADANNLLASEGFGIASGAVLGALLSRFVSWRLLCSVSLILAILGNLLSATISEAGTAISLARSLTGLGEGGVIVLSFSMIGLTERIERNIALYLTVLLTYGALGLWLMPLALEVIGLNGIFLGWAIITIVSLGLIPYLPPFADSREVPSRTAAYVGLPMLAVAILSVLAYNTAIGIAWANLFFVGMGIKEDDEAVATALLASQFIAIGGAILAVILEKKIGRWPPIISGILVGAGSISLLLGNPSFLIFAIAVCLFNFIWNFFLPFMLSSVEDMRLGEMMTIIIAVQMIGLTVAGPLTAARILESGGSLQTALTVTIVLMLISLVGLSLAKIARRKALAQSKL